MGEVTKSLYVIGGPGCGKSTLMAETLAGWVPGPYERWTAKEMFGHYLRHPQKGHGAYLGHLRPRYPGTDALSLSVAPQALLWMESLPLLGLDWVFGEGFRLSHFSFLSALHAATDLTVVHLTVSPEEGARRREARGGRPISEQYARLATTKARNLAQVCQEAGIRVMSWSTD